MYARAATSCTIPNDAAAAATVAINGRAIDSAAVKAGDSAKSCALGTVIGEAFESGSLFVVHLENLNFQAVK